MSLGFSRLFRAAGRSAPVRRPAPSARLSCEQLESRIVPTNFDIARAQFQQSFDSQTGDLINRFVENHQKIDAAEQHAVGDAVNLAESLAYMKDNWTRMVSEQINESMRMRDMLLEDNARLFNERQQQLDAAKGNAVRDAALGVPGAAERFEQYGIMDAENRSIAAQKAGQAGLASQYQIEAWLQRQALGEENYQQQISALKDQLAAEFKALEDLRANMTEAAKATYDELARQYQNNLQQLADLEAQQAQAEADARAAQAQAQAEAQSQSGGGGGGGGGGSGGGGSGGNSTETCIRYETNPITGQLICITD